MERINFKKLQNFMDKYSLDIIILMNPAVGEYFTGFMPLEHRDFCPEERSMIFVFLHKGDPFVIYRNQEISLGFKFKNILDVYPCGLMLQEKAEVLIRELKKRKFTKGKIGIEIDFMPVLVKENLTSNFHEVTFIDISPLSRQLIVPKDKYQLSCIEKALIASEKGLQAMFHELKKKEKKTFITRQEIYTIYQRTISSYQVQFFDSRHLTTREILKYNNLAFFDMVTCYDGYVSDFCLPFYMGKNPPEELISRSRIGQKIIENIASTIKPDMSGEIAEKAIDTRLKKIFGSEYEFLNIQARWVTHGLGIRIHEEPLLGRDYRAKSRSFAKEIICFEKGCVISVEICGLMEQMYKMTGRGLVRMGKMKAKLYSL